MKRWLVISLALLEGRAWSMPPDLRALSAAGPGKYRLRDTSETVSNPDLLATWTITEPARH